MHTLNTEILILGGGATGTALSRPGNAWLKTILVEQNDLATARRVATMVYYTQVADMW